MTTALLQLKESALLLCEHVPDFRLASRTSPIGSVWRSACSSLMVASLLPDSLTGRYRRHQAAVTLQDLPSLASYNAFFTRNALLLLSYYPLYLHEKAEHRTKLWRIFCRDPDSGGLQHAPHDAGPRASTVQSRTALHRPFPSLHRRPCITVQSPARLLGLEFARFHDLPPHLRPPGLDVSVGEGQNVDVSQEKSSTRSKEEDMVADFHRKLDIYTRGDITELLDAVENVIASGMVDQLRAVDLFTVAEAIERVNIVDEKGRISRQRSGVILRQVLDDLRRRLAIASKPESTRIELAQLSGPVSSAAAKAQLRIALRRAPKRELARIRKTMGLEQKTSSMFLSLEQRVARLDVWNAAMQREWDTCMLLLHDLVVECSGIKHPSIADCIARVMELAVSDDLPDAVINICLDNFSGVLELPIRWVHKYESTEVRRTFHDQETMMRRAVFDAISTIKLPVEWLQSKAGSWEQIRMRRACRLLLYSLLYHEETEATYAVYNYMTENHPHSDHPYSGEHSLLERIAVFLAQKESYDAAEAVFQRLLEIDKKGDSGTVSKLRTVWVGLQLAAHQGQVERAERFFQELSEQGWRIGTREQNWLLHASAVKGRLEHLVQLFDAFFPKDSAGVRFPAPRVAHYTSMILGFARHRGLEEANEWLEEMKRAGHVSDLYVYNVLLAELAARKETAAVAALFKQMQEAGHKPDGVSYTAAINLYTGLKDPIAAEDILKRAIAQGITPDRQLLVRLINTHVEAASWKGVIRVFDYIINLPYRSLHLSIDLCNALLKAYVRIGAPHYTIRGIFNRLGAFDAVPNMRTYGLIIQSAVDSGRMAEADRLFMDMLEECGREASDPDNVYALSALIAGYLRMGKNSRAKKIYEDMVAYNIQPATATFAAIIRSQARASTPERLQATEEFLQDVLRHMPDHRTPGSPRTREESLTQLYQPLLRAYLRLGQASEVERVFTQMIEAGGTSTLATLVYLLDVYRITLDVESMQKVWEEMYSKALELLHEPPIFPPDESEGKEEDQAAHRYPAYLGMSLSIYVDGLSVAGQHARIAEVLMQMRKEGFAFTAHNWNHIAVAMLRAGEPERAFEVLERVILPYQRETERLVRERNLHPQTPFVFDPSGTLVADTMSVKLEDVQPSRYDAYASGEEEDVPDEGADVPDEPVMSARARAKRVRQTTRVVPVPGQDVMGEQEMETPADLVHTLHVLQQVSPAWHLWRPHGRTLQVLQQYLIGSTGIRERLEKDLGLAADMRDEASLQKIYDGYPEAARAVIQFRRTKGRGGRAKKRKRRR